MYSSYNLELARVFIDIQSFVRQSEMANANLTA